MDAEHLLLIGGGHAHVAVLADWIRRGAPCRTTLLTPHPTLRYSGMVPGWISGEHDVEAGLVDLAKLAQAAGVELVLGRCVGIDPELQVARTETGDEIAFDIASIDTGGVGQAARVLGDDPRLLDVRPIDGFVDRLAGELNTPRADPLRIAVIGGGAGGFELAFALRNVAGRAPAPDVTIFLGSDGALPGFANGVQRAALKALDQQGIRSVQGEARFEDGQLIHDGLPQEPQDIIVAAIGSAAPDWPRASGIAVDEAGFIAVDKHQRSTSHPRIFAVGDVAARRDRDVPHSGVHAVHAGPVLAANLRAVITGSQSSRSYQPRPASLYLLSTGDGSAIGSYGPLVAQGRWAGRLKRWIDKRWIASYAQVSKQV